MSRTLSDTFRSRPKNKDYKLKNVRDKRNEDFGRKNNVND
jgi:hypothetical protein